jgi:hypothetical protein
MKAFDFLLNQLSDPDADQGAGHFENWVTAVLVGFLALVTIIVLI